MFCTECGKKIADNVKYCPYCGQKIFFENILDSNDENFSLNDENFSFETGINTEQNIETPPIQNKVNESQEPIGNTKYAGFAMKWYNFLIYFSLWAGALVNLGSGIAFISGYKENGGVFEYELYPYFDGLQFLDILYGILCFALAVFVVIVRFRLARLKKGAPLLYLLYLTVSFGTSIFYDFTYLIILSQRINISSEIAHFAGTIIGRGIVVLILVFLNRRYFIKRESLFVN